MRSNPLYYIAPSNINLSANANGHADDIAVYIASVTKIKVYCSAIPELDYVNDTFREWTMTGKNRRLNGGSGPYTIYARLPKSGGNGYLVMAPQQQTDGQWKDKYPWLNARGEIIPGYFDKAWEDYENWYIRLGEVSAVENERRAITLDTGILGTDAWKTQWEMDETIISQYGTLDISVEEEGSESSASSESPTNGERPTADTVIDVDGDNYDHEYELDGRKERPSAYYNRAAPEDGRFQPNMLLDRKTGEFMAARGKFHIYEDGDIEILADRMEMTANTEGSMPSFRLHSANKDRSIVFESVLSQELSPTYTEWFGFAAPVTVSYNGQTATGDILSLGVRRRNDNTGWARLVLRNVEMVDGTPVSESATLLDNDSIAFYRDSQGWTPQNLQDGAANLRIGIDGNGFPYVFSNIGGGPGGLPTEANLASLPVGGLYIDANGFLKVKGQ